MLKNIINTEMQTLKKQIGNTIEVTLQRHKDSQIIKNRLVALSSCGFIMLENGYSFPFIGVTGGIRLIKDSNNKTIYTNESLMYKKDFYNISNPEDDNFIEELKIKKFGEEYTKKETGWFFH